MGSTRSPSASPLVIARPHLVVDDVALRRWRLGGAHLWKGLGRDVAPASSRFRHSSDSGARSRQDFFGHGRRALPRHQGPSPLLRQPRGTPATRSGSSTSSSRWHAAAEQPAARLPSACGWPNRHRESGRARCRVAVAGAELELKKFPHAIVPPPGSFPAHAGR